MSYTVSFISLGCAKNQVNCEQMMAAVQSAGHNIQVDPAGADVVVVNTCGFLASACEEAIDNILEMAELKKAGQVKKIIVTGCMAQRYKGDVLTELPEVDAILGTGSYGDIAAVIEAVMAGGSRPCLLGNIHTAPQNGPRILSTPPWYAYLRIAEGCDNHCAYCVIPSLRGKYRSRPMAELLDEAAELASAGVKELLVIAQDITRYGTDWGGGHKLAELLRPYGDIPGSDMKEVVEFEFDHAWSRSAGNDIPQDVKAAADNYLSECFGKDRARDFLALFLCDTFVERDRSAKKNREGESHD